MKKLFVFTVLMLLALVLVACGGESVVTTDNAPSETTMPVTSVSSVSTTAPVTTVPMTTLPETTAPVTTVPVTTVPETTTASPFANIKLPTSGIKELAVDQNSIQFNKTCWAADPPKGAFDGETNDTKLGTPNANGSAILQFSLTEAATVTYYTFYTGNDTAPDLPRNPLSWVMYGKVGEEWVELSKVGPDQDTGMALVSCTPYSYVVQKPMECKDYKFVFVTETVFQLNEVVMYKNDVSVITPTAAALLDGAEVLRTHAIAKINKETYEIRTTFYPTDRFDSFSLSQVKARGAYAWVKDATNNGEWIRYNVELITTSRGLDINFFLDETFVPVAGVKYDMQFYFYGGDFCMFPGKIHVVYEYGFELAQ